MGMLCNGCVRFSKVRVGRRFGESPLTAVIFNEAPFSKHSEAVDPVDGCVRNMDAGFVQPSLTLHHSLVK